MAVLFALAFFLLLAWFVVTQSRIQKKGTSRRGAVFEEVSEKLAGSHFVFDRGSDYPVIMKLKKIYYEARPSDLGNFYIRASVESIYYEEDPTSWSMFKVFKADDVEIRKYSEIQMRREFVWNDSYIERAVGVGMEMLNYRSINQGGLEDDLCDLLFENIYELSWALDNLNLLNEQIESLSRVRDQSKSNELLHPYCKKVIRAVRVLAEKRVEIYSYWREAEESAVKIFEYLSVPAAVKNIDKLNLDPLRVSVKGRELRDSFQKVKEIHKELEQI